MAELRSMIQQFFIHQGANAAEIDRSNKAAAEMRATWLAAGWDPSAVYEELSSDSDEEYDEDNQLLTPPASPKEGNYSLSILLRNY